MTCLRQLRKKICASDYQWEIWKPSEIRWSTCLPRPPHGGAVRKICRDMEMQNEAGHICLNRPISSISSQSGGSSAGRLLPYGFHDEANDHRQSHAATHRSDDDGCDFTCRGGTRRAATHGCLQINYRRRRKNETIRRNRLLVQMRTDQRRAPSTTLQQIERTKWMRL